MAVIAHRFGYKFQLYKINLCGALSTIQLRHEVNAKEKPKKYPLYYQVLDSSKAETFNIAVGYLLQCLKSLQDYALQVIQAKDGQQKFALYEIVKESSGFMKIDN